jgi:hypothetical protein
MLGLSAQLSMAPISTWFQRWNFIERARLERQLWECFERGEDLESLLSDCRGAVAAGNGERAFQLEIWEVTLRRIRRIEAMMADRQRPGA